MFFIRNKCMKIFKLLMLCALSLWVFSISAAESSDGVINRIYLTKGVADRGACIKMTPAITSSSGWACLYGKSSNHAYQEMTSLLLTAYASKAACTVFWDAEVTPPGHADIKTIECF